MKPERKKSEEKLYRQWVKHGELPPEAVPPKRSPREEGPSRESLRDVPAPKERSRESVERGFPILYIVIGVTIFVVGIGFGLLLAQSC